METIYHKKVSLSWQCLYDRDRQLIFYNFADTFNVSIMIECNRAMMKFIETNRAIAIYTNALQGKGSFSSMNKFSNEELIPHCEKHGIKVSAFCLSTNVFTRFAMNQVLKLTKSTMEMRIFDNHVSAKDWIETNIGKEIVLPESFNHN